MKPENPAHLVFAFCIISLVARVPIAGGWHHMMHKMMMHKMMMHKMKEHHHEHKGISLSFKPIALPIPIPIAYVDKGHMKAEPWPQESKGKGMMMAMMKMKMKMMKGWMKGMKKMKAKKCCPMMQQQMAWPSTPMMMCPQMMKGCDMMMPAMKACPMKAVWPKKKPMMMCEEPEEEEEDEEEETEIPEEVAGWPDYYERELEEEQAGWDTRPRPVYTSYHVTSSSNNKKGDDLEDAESTLKDGIVWVRVRRTSKDKGDRPSKKAVSRKSFDYDYEYF